MPHLAFSQHLRVKTSFFITKLKQASAEAQPQYLHYQFQHHIFLRSFPHFLVKLPMVGQRQTASHSVKWTCHVQFELGDGSNTVSESTVPNTELGEIFSPHRAPGRELSELLSAYDVCVRLSELTESFAELTEFAAELSEFCLPRQCSWNSIPPISYEPWLQQKQLTQWERAKPLEYQRNLTGRE